MDKIIKNLNNIKVLKEGEISLNLKDIHLKKGVDVKLTIMIEETKPEKKVRKIGALEDKMTYELNDFEMTTDELLNL